MTQRCREPVYNLTGSMECSVAFEPSRRGQLTIMTLMYLRKPAAIVSSPSYVTIDATLVTLETYHLEAKKKMFLFAASTILSTFRSSWEAT